jgi:hypothetical protein
MSHFTTVKTKLRDLTCVKRAAEDLGLVLVESETPVEVRGFQGAIEKSNLMIKATEHFDIGLNQTAEGVELMADWWGIEMETGLKEKDWVDRFNQRYAYHKVIKEVKSRGFTLEEELEEDGELKLTVRKWQ